MNLPDFPIRESFAHWHAHLTDFWVPLFIAVIFAGLAAKAIAHKNFPLFLFNLILVAACLGYMGYSDQIMTWARQWVEKITG